MHKLACKSVMSISVNYHKIIHFICCWPFYLLWLRFVLLDRLKSTTAWPLLGLWLCVFFFLLLRHSKIISQSWSIGGLFLERDCRRPSRDTPVLAAWAEVDLKAGEESSRRARHAGGLPALPLMAAFSCCYLYPASEHAGPCIHILVPSPLRSSLTLPSAVVPLVWNKYQFCHLSRLRLGKENHVPWVTALEFFDISLFYPEFNT